MNPALALFVATLAATGPAADGDGCDADALMAFDAGVGPIRSREALTTDQDVQVEEEVSRAPASCVDAETDAACEARITQESAALVGPGQELRVVLEGPRDHVLATTDVAGERVEKLYKSHRAVADDLEAAQAAGKDVTLVSARAALDPSARTAAVMIVELRTVSEAVGPGVRMVFQPQVSHLEALQRFQQLATETGITAVSWNADSDAGTIEVELRCVDP